MNTQALIHDLQDRLDAAATPKTKAWWEKYMKYVIPFRGAKMGDIRKALHTWRADHDLASRLTPDQELDLALALFPNAHAEDKLAGVLYLQEVLIPGGMVDWPRDLPRLAALFQEGHIYDWNVCDWFCVKVLGPLAAREGPACARAIAAWVDGETIWQRRAAGVAFVNLAAEGEANFTGFTQMLLDVCAVTVQDPARFAQTGTGWVLRELWVAEPEQVTAFVRTHLAHFSTEGLRYATEKMADPLKAELLAARSGPSSHSAG